MITVSIIYCLWELFTMNRKETHRFGASPILFSQISKSEFKGVVVILHHFQASFYLLFSPAPQL